MNYPEEVTKAAGILCDEIKKSFPKIDIEQFKSKALIFIYVELNNLGELK